MSILLPSASFAGQILSGFLHSSAEQPYINDSALLQQLKAFMSKLLVTRGTFAIGLERAVLLAFPGKKIGAGTAALLCWSRGFGSRLATVPNAL